MHIAFLIPTLDRIGGAERQVCLLANGLSSRGWQVSVIALSGSGGDAAAELSSRGIAFLSLHMRKGLADPRGWILLHYWIQRNQPDVLHSHLPHAVLMGRLSRFLTPFRILVETIHSPATGSLVLRSAYRLSRAQPDAITAVSRAAAEPWLDQRLVQEAQLTVIPNGIDLGGWRRDPQLRSATRQSLSLRDEFAWLSVGRLDPVKNHAMLLCALAKLPTHARLIVAGAGPLAGALQSQAAELGIQGKVRFPGFQTDVLPLMQAADAFVLTSHWEGLPMAFLEAASCELPAVVTDIPAMRELAPERSAQTLVPVDDSDALAAAMRAMMGLSECDRVLVGKELRESVAGQFSLEVVLNRWEQTYRDLLAARPQRSRSGLATSVPRGKTFQLQ